ncbi:hypothetical protein VQ056_27050 [Paenibacillus sp. JTLBN-2024]
MIVLLVMLDRGLDEWFKPILPEEAAPFFCEYLTDKEYRKLTPHASINSTAFTRPATSGLSYAAFAGCRRGKGNGKRTKLRAGAHKGRRWFFSAAFSNGRCCSYPVRNDWMNSGLNWVVFLIALAVSIKAEPSRIRSQSMRKRRPSPERMTFGIVTSL